MTSKKENIFWLNGGGNLINIRFEVTGEDHVNVLGLLSAVYYISKGMTKQEARDYYSKKIKEGWKKLNNEDAPSYAAHECTCYGR